MPDMDQGIAAVWAGAAGLFGAAIGGCAAVWGAAIGGKRSVEAAERAARNESSSNFQQWQRQERSEAYREMAALGHQVVAVLTAPVADEEWRSLQDRMMLTVNRVRIAGPPEADTTASALAHALLYVSVIEAGTPGYSTLVRVVPNPRFTEFVNAYNAFIGVATQTVNQAPA